MPLKAGFRLGPYEVQSFIGAGGTGEVHKALDTRLDRTVAIKVLSPYLAGNEAARERLEREAKVVSRLNHPHICTLYDGPSRSRLDPEPDPRALRRVRRAGTTRPAQLNMK